jgi:hypothetical protein
MDRRFAQSRSYGGERASDSRRQQADALVRNYLGQARKSWRDGQSYGGSTGGSQSAGEDGLNALLNRNAETKQAREIFRQYGSGDLGARAALAEGRGFRQPPSATTGLS